jgi:thiamine biosynthesis lipoprotein
MTRVACRVVEQCMGTVFSFDIRPPGAPESALDEAVAWLHAMDAAFSTYRPNSWVNRLERSEVELADCPDVVREVLRACENLRIETDGAFDHYATGRLDPSGFVKGWAIQRVSDQLEAAGSTNHCINGGGDVQCVGRPTPDRDWRVGIVDPLHSDRTIATASGQRLALATSGTAERGLHIVDPRSGRAVDDWASVTVIGTQIVRADACATAAAATGSQAQRWLEERELTGVLVDRTGTVTTVPVTRQPT